MKSRILRLGGLHVHLYVSQSNVKLNQYYNYSVMLYSACMRGLRFACAYPGNLKNLNFKFLFSVRFAIYVKLSTNDWEDYVSQFIKCQTKPTLHMHLIISFYLFSGEDHQRDDWLSIHEQICPIVSVLRSNQPHAIGEEERAHRKHQQTLRKVCVCVCWVCVCVCVVCVCVFRPQHDCAILASSPSSSQLFSVARWKARGPGI